MLSRKPYLILFLLSCAVFNALSQENRVSAQEKNELSLSLFGIKSQYGLWFSRDFYTSLFTGISYKRHFGFNSLRIGLHSRDASDTGSGDFCGTSSYRENKFTIGYQRKFLIGSIKPYIGADLIYLISSFHEEFSGGFWGAYSKMNLRENGVGFAPVMGINFLLNNSISISCEANFEFLYINMNGTEIRNNTDDISARDNYEIHQYENIKLLNPINNLTLNYSF